MSKNLIFQIYLGENRALYDFCTASVRAYSEVIGADYVQLVQPQLKIVPDFNKGDRSQDSIHPFGCLPIFEKSFGLTFLKDYDKVAIIDADIYIKPDSPNIFDEIDDETCFGGVIESDLPSVNWHTVKLKTYSRMQYHNENFKFYNMGMMLFSKSIIKYMPFDINIDGIRKFIMQEKFQDFVNGKGYLKWSTDQTLYNTWLVDEDIPRKNLDPKFNCLFGTVENDYLKSAYFIHFFLADKLPNEGNDIAYIKEKAFLNDYS